MATELVEEYLVEAAVRALAAFCQRHGYEMEPGCLARFAIAWRERRSYELTPCVPAFRRILAVMPLRPGAKIAIVFNYQDVDQQLTDELHASIMKATGGRFPEESVEDQVVVGPQPDPELLKQIKIIEP